MVKLWFFFNAWLDDRLGFPALEALPTTVRCVSLWSAGGTGSWVGQPRGNRPGGRGGPDEGPSPLHHSFDLMAVAPTMDTVPTADQFGIVPGKDWERRGGKKG